MPSFIGTVDTLRACIEAIQTHRPGIYLRFGDGDFNIAKGERELLCVPSPSFSGWMNRTMHIRNEPNVMICLPHHCSAFGTLEDGMFPGNHECPERMVSGFLQQLGMPHPSKIYSSVALSFCSSKNPDLVVNLHNHIRKHAVVFVGNYTYTTQFLQSLFGSTLYRIDVNERDSYKDHDAVMARFNTLYCETLRDLDYFVIVMAAGCGGRAYSGELYHTYQLTKANFFVFDYGSLLDYLAGLNTRAYMDLDPPKKDYILTRLNQNS
jgi:hypothetical protein